MKFLSQINVNSEYTFPIVDGTNGQVLTTDGNGAVYWNSIAASITTLDGLSDVILTSPSSGQLLRYGIPPGSGETQPVWYNFTPNYLTPSSSIDNLSDVTITSVASGQILQYNGTAWVNTTLSTVEYVSKVQHIVKAGVAITKGQAVYVTGSDGTNMIVGLASNTSEGTSSKVMGLAASNAAINDQIFVVTEGLLAGLNTSTATAGDPVWLGANGNLIFGLLNKPTSPAHLVYIGVVTRVQQNNGEIFVKVQNGIEIDEIHDVQISSPATGQLLRRDSDGYWKNWSPNFLTTEADTLATVTARGATTTGNITVNGAAFATSFSSTALFIANADTSGSLQPDQGSPANKIYSFRWAGNEQGYIDTDAKITFAGFKTPTGTASQFLKANGTVDSSVYITSAALSGYATQAWVNSNFYNQSQIDDFFGGAEPISGYNKSNWDTAYNDKVNSASFNTTNGILTLTQQDGGTVTVDLDGRYLTSDTDAQTLTWEAPTKNLSITNGNTVTLEGLATEDYVLSQGFISSESDTLATVTARGNISNTKIQIRTAGNAAGGNIQLGPYSDGASKWGFITSQHFNSSLEPEGFSVIGGLALNGVNAVVIGGNIYESNPATQIQFWTHSSDTHGLGGTQRGVIDSSGNWGVGTTNPQYRLDVAGGNVRLSQGYESVRIHGVDLLGYSSGNLWQIGNTTYSSLVLSTSWDWDRQVEFNYTPNTTGQVAGVLRIGQMQKNSATWTHGRTEFYVNGSVRSNINTYGVGIGREAASNEKLTIDLSDGVWGVHIYNAGTAIGGLHANSNVITLQSDGNRNIEIATGTGNANWNGNIIATRTWVQAQGYLTSETDSQDLTWDSGSKTLGITNGNSVVLENLATEDYVTSQGYVTSSHTHTIANVTGLQTALDGKAASSHTHSASDITSGTISTDRLPKQELGISIVGNFGQWQGHSTYQNLNTDVAYWGWNFVQGSTNAPHQSSSQWYRGRFSLGDEYGLGTSPGDYWMEIAIPRYNQDSTAGNLFVRTCENGSINAWQGVRAAYATDADTLDGNHASAFALASHTHTIANVTGLQTALDGKLSAESDSEQDVGGRHFRFNNGINRINIDPRWNESGYDADLGVFHMYSTTSAGVQWGRTGIALFSGSAYQYLTTKSGTTGIFLNNQEIIHSGNIGSQSVAYATSAGSSTNLYGPAGSYIKMSTSGTSYQNNYQIRENDGGGSNTSEIYAPQLAFHWAGVVASSIMMEASGRIAIRNNPGTGYEAFVAGIIYSSGYGNSTQWSTAYGWGNHADAPYWNVSSTDPKDVESTLVTFRHDVTILGTLTESSSIRLKENITPLDPALDKVNQLEAVSYNKIGVDNREIGLIAEDVAELFPEVVTYNEEGQPQGIQYQRLSVILLKAVQELSQEVNELKKKLN